MTYLNSWELFGFIEAKFDVYINASEHVIGLSIYFSLLSGHVTSCDLHSYLYTMRYVTDLLYYCCILKFHCIYLYISIKLMLSLIIFVCLCAFIFGTINMIGKI